jgi:hypothetical protein
VFRVGIGMEGVGVAQNSEAALPPSPNFITLATVGGVSEQGAEENIWIKEG